MLPSSENTRKYPENSDGFTAEWASWRRFILGKKARKNIPDGEIKLDFLVKKRKSENEKDWNYSCVAVRPHADWWVLMRCGNFVHLILGSSHDRMILTAGNLKCHFLDSAEVPLKSNLSQTCAAERVNKITTVGLLCLWYHLCVCVCFILKFTDVNSPCMDIDSNQRPVKT